MENCPLFSVSHFWGALHVYVDFASRGRTQIPDAKPADDIHDIDKSDHLLNSLLNEMKRVLDQDDLDSFLFE
jgi:hypothetical protein